MEAISDFAQHPERIQRESDGLFYRQRGIPVQKLRDECGLSCFGGCRCSYAGQVPSQQNEKRFSN